MSKRIVVFLLSFTVLAGAARAQSLADLAKKEEERRKSLPAPTKVYTNKDLNAVPPPPVAPAKPADAKEGDKAAKDALIADEKDKEPKRDQAYWSNRMKQLQDQLLSNENYADAMQTRINALTTDFVNRDDPAQKAVIEQNRQKALLELDHLTKNVKDITKAIADFQEEARHAGVPPGWLR